jgi:hypothetical protein
LKKNFDLKIITVNTGIKEIKEFLFISVNLRNSFIPGIYLEGKNACNVM